MSVIMSFVVTALAISPVFLLAGWFREHAPATIRGRFNSLNRRS